MAGLEYGGYCLPFCFEGWSFLFRKEAGTGETPEAYFWRAKECMIQAQTMIRRDSLKFYHGQCKYLVGKLERAVQSAHSLLQAEGVFSFKKDAESLRVFKFLYASAKEVETFVDTCCKVPWIQAVVFLTDVSKQALSIGFCLEEFQIAFSKSNEENEGSSSGSDGGSARDNCTLNPTNLTELVSRHIGEVEDLEIEDNEMLLANVEFYIKSGMSQSDSDRQLADFLLARLRWITASNVPKPSPPGVHAGFFSSLKKVKRLGEGAAGFVHESELLGAKVAMKSFHGPDNPDFEKEVSISAGFSHPNILCLFGCGKRDQSENFIVMEAMDGDLLALIEERAAAIESPFTILEAVDYMLQVGEGVLYLHANQKCTHRDLKCQNILFKRARASGYVFLKLADFGSSKKNRCSVTFSNQTSNMGTNRWLAPELIKLSDGDCVARRSGETDVLRFPYMSDVYSFSMVCYEILAQGKPPFYTLVPNAVKKAVLDGNRPQLPNCPYRLKVLIEKCWSKNPSERPTFGDICKELRYLKCLLMKRAIGTASVADLRNIDTKTREVKDLKMDPIDAALKIIPNVIVTANNVCLNKNQCRRLADRFGDIYTALESSKHKRYGSHFFLDISTNMDQILAVLKKGQALVQDYADENKALHNFLYRVDNIEAFREVHDDIDALGTFRDLDQTEKTTLLNFDAVTDVRNIEIQAVTEKCYEPLSYLNIPFSAIHLDGAIKELKPLALRQSQADAHLDGKVLVHKGTWKDCVCAIKVFKSTDPYWNEQELDKEIRSLVKLRHPHVTQLIGCSKHENKTYVLYEMMDSDLRVLINRSCRLRSMVELRRFFRPFSRTKEVGIITQIARGMFYLHEQGLVHGELKCTNLLVRVRGDHTNVKVADFHCSRELGKTPTGKYKPSHRPRWMPPEAFEHYNVDQPSDDLLMKGDVYSFAMTCYEVVTGRYPFDGIRGGEAVQEKLKAGERPELPEDLSKDLKSLITKCWHQDPEQRPSFQDICYVLKELDIVTFGTSGDEAEPVRDVLEGKEWTDLDFWEVDELDRAAIQEIDDVARSLPHHLQIQSSDLKPLRLLGKGSSAVIYEASWIGCRFAVKWLKMDHVAKLRHEVSIMMKLLHPHVIRLVGFSVLCNRCAIVMEMLDTSLRDLMDSRIKASKDPNHIPFQLYEAMDVIRKLARGMDFLHSRGVIHGNLKSNDVLLRNTHLKGGGWDVKLGDFGLSKVLPDQHTSVGQLQGLGDGWSRAPEVIRMGYSWRNMIDLKAADVYSFAMVCSEVITGKKPFQEYSYDRAKTLAMAGGGPKLDNVNVRPELKRLLEDCWSKPEDRPKFDQILMRLTQI